MLYFLVFNTSARLIYSTIETYEEIASNAGDHEVIPLGPSRVRWDFQFRHRTRSFRSTGRLRLWILEPQRCPAPHSEAAAINMASLPYASEYRKLLESFDHRDGKDLIGKKHLSDEEGWKLPSKYIPYLAQYWSLNTSQASSIGILGIPGEISQRNHRRLCS